jgi:hypothetical protein
MAGENPEAGRIGNGRNGASRAEASRLGRLISGFVHDMSNPLGFVQANLMQVADYADDLARLHEAVLTLCTELRQTARVETPALTDLEHLLATMQPDRTLKDLDAAVHESLEGARRIRSSLFDLQDLLGEQRSEASAEVAAVVTAAVQALRAAASPHPVVREEIAPRIRARGSAGTLQRTLLTLLLRASEAVAQRGPQNNGTARELRVYAGRRGGEICLSLTDTGVPLTPDERSALTRVDSPEAGGLAELGLARAASQLRELDGSLRFESGESGTHIEIRLPAAPAA